MIGRTISHYSILAKLGEGGMGVVYKAEDTRLHRTVALKFLRPEAVENQETKARFLNEAEAAAALDHPNICTVYEIDEVDGEMFIAMVCIEGQTLAEKIDDRPLPLPESLDIAMQVAEGLRAAHEKGIVHRDTKPANVMIDSEGRAKITDFGLARLEEATKITRTGTTVGTPAYMSPEQVRGEDLDQRSDIWSLGVVLYETLTGRLPFRGEVREAVAHSILYEEPDPLTALRAGLPLDLDRVIRKALSKDRRDRYQHVEDMAVDLRALKRQIESGTTTQSIVTGGKRSPWLKVIATAAAAVLIALVAWFLPQKTPPSRDVQVRTLTTLSGGEWFPTFSPSGDRVAFTWQRQNGEENWNLYVQQVAGGSPQALTQRAAISPSWSPDGSQIAFTRPGRGREKLITIPAIGGLEREHLEIGRSDAGSPSDLAGRTLCWTPDGQSLVWSLHETRDRPAALFMISLGTGERRRLTNPPSNASGDAGAAVSPDGRRLAFHRAYSMNLAEVLVVEVGSDGQKQGDPRVVPSENPFNIEPVWSPNGEELVFASGASRFDTMLYRIPADLSAPPAPVPGTNGAFFVGASSDGGLVAYSEFVGNHDIWRIELDRAGGAIGDTTRLLGSTACEHWPDYSPDGRRIAVSSLRSGRGEIWISDADGTGEVQLTFNGGFGPKWSPDGRRIAFVSDRNGNNDVYVLNAAGSGLLQLTSDSAPDGLPLWTADGEWVYFLTGREGRESVWKVPAGGGTAVRTERQVHGVESADGSRVFFLQEHDVWVRDNETGAESVLIDCEGWVAEFAVTEPGIYAVAGGSLYFSDFGSKRLHQLGRVPGDPGHGFAASPDGRTILFAELENFGADLRVVEGLW